MLKSILALSILLAAASATASAQWESVKPLTQSFDVDVSLEMVSVDLPIVSDDGSVVYFLACRGGSTKALDELFERDDINWAGLFMCILNAGDRLSSESSLLAEDDSPPWHTRGYFSKNGLVGSCGEYPEFGRERNFRLRGFVLRLSVQNLELREDGSIRRFDFVVSIEKDAEARGAQAERPNYLMPRDGNCDVIQTGRDPRYCRISTGPETGSWELCPDQ